MEMKQITISIPTIKFGLLDRLKTDLIRLKMTVSLFLNRFLRDGLLNFFNTLAAKIKEKRQVNFQNSIGQIGQNSPRRARNFNFKYIFKIGIILVISGAILIGGVKAVKNISGGKSLVGGDSRAEVKGAKASQDIYRDFTFPLRNEKNEQVGEIKYNIEKVEFRDEIVVKGQKASAVKGRTFLIINLKVTNQFNQTIQMNTRDYVRLSLNGNENEWLAADIHNDPVEVQAQSTKYTRIGFPVNDSDKNLVLRIGEITGDKENINLELK